MHEHQVRKQIEQRRKEGQKRKSRLIAKIEEKAVAGQQLKMEKDLMTEARFLQYAQNRRMKENFDQDNSNTLVSIKALQNNLQVKLQTQKQARLKMARTPVRERAITIDGIQMIEPQRIVDVQKLDYFSEPNSPDMVVHKSNAFVT